MVAVTTMGAAEVGTVTDAELSASGTESAGVTRINKSHSNALLQSLVPDEPLELGKRPRLVDVPLPLSDLGSLPDVLEVFHHEDVVWRGGLDYPLADGVVQVADYPAFLAREPFQEPLGSLGAFGLEGSPQIRKVPPYVHSLLARKPETIGCGGEVADAEVYPDRVSSLWSGDSPREDDIDVVSPLSAISSIDHHSGSGSLPLKEMPLVVAQNKGDSDSAVDCGERDHFLGGDVTENPLVIGHRSRLEAPDLAEFPLGRLGHSGDGSDGEVGGQAVSLPDFIIAEVLEFDLVCRAVVLGYLQRMIAGIGKSLKGCPESLGLLRAGIEFARGCFDKFHSDTEYITLGKEVSSAFLPCLKAWASCA